MNGEEIYDSKSSNSRSILTAYMADIVDRLQSHRYRSSTMANYYRVWKLMNDFYLQLDFKPNTWEDTLILFIRFLVNKKRKLSTVKCYISAIKAVLDIDGHPINEDKATLKALVRACRLHNDNIDVRFPIKRGLLQLIINGVKEIYANQPYLSALYQALFATAYFGLFRIGELTFSEHVVKAVDVHVGTNKDKLMFVLHSSKTHSRGMKPQIIKISSQKN